MRSMNAVLLDWRPKRTAHVRVATANNYSFTVILAFRDLGLSDLSLSDLGMFRWPLPVISAYAQWSWPIFSELGQWSWPVGQWSWPIFSELASDLGLGDSDLGLWCSDLGLYFYDVTQRFVQHTVLSTQRLISYVLMMWWLHRLK